MERRRILRRLHKPRRHHRQAAFGLGLCSPDRAQHVCDAALRRQVEHVQGLKEGEAHGGAPCAVLQRARLERHAVLLHLGGMSVRLKALIASGLRLVGT